MYAEGLVHQSHYNLPYKLSHHAWSVIQLWPDNGTRMSTIECAVHCLLRGCDQQWWGCENGPCPACDKLSLGTRLPTQRERRSLVPRLVLDCDWLLGNPAGNLNRRCLQLCSFSTTFRCQQSLLIWVTIFSWGTYTPPERGLDLVYWSILWVARLCWSQNEHLPGLEVILVWGRGIERFLFSWICCPHTLN